MSLTDKKRFAWLTAQGMTDAGAAADMANSYYESGLKSNNLQNTYNTSLGMTDAEYTAAVDDGSYTNFSSDSAGYGLYQWTYKTRKAALLKYVQAASKSIGDDETQLKFHIKELKESYSSVWKTLTTSTDVQECSDAFLTKYEKPADQSSSVKTKRATKAQEYYDKYASTTTSSTSSTSTSSSTTSTPTYTTGKTYTTKVDKLRVRAGAGTKYSVKSYAQLTSNAKANAYSNGTLKIGTKVTCKGTSKDSSGNIWMKIPSGYIAAYYESETYVG